MARTEGTKLDAHELALKYATAYRDLVRDVKNLVTQGALEIGNRSMERGISQEDTNLLPFLTQLVDILQKSTDSVDSETNGRDSH